MAMKIWHQSFTVLSQLPPYAAALQAHFHKVARPDTEVVMHGMASHPNFIASCPTMRCAISRR